MIHISTSEKLRVTIQYPYKFIIFINNIHIHMV
jgi:hypothetical protein